MTAKNTPEDPLRFWVKGSPIASAAEFSNCPIDTSLGVLGRKWTMHILREMSMRKAERFSDLIRSVPGITPRALSMRLKDLEQAGMIIRTDDRSSPRFVKWGLTEKGWDALPILMSYVAFGSKWFGASVFADGQPREMKDIYPQQNLRQLYVNIEVDPVKVKKALKKESSSGQTAWND